MVETETPRGVELAWKCAPGTAGHITLDPSPLTSPLGLLPHRLHALDLGSDTVGACGSPAPLPEKSFGLSCHPVGNGEPAIPTAKPQAHAELRPQLRSHLKLMELTFSVHNKEFL